MQKLFHQEKEKKPNEYICKIKNTNDAVEEIDFSKGDSEWKYEIYYCDNCND